MATRRPVRFGAVGCGGAGTHRIREIAAHELGVEVVAAADIKPERLDNLERVLDTRFRRYETADGYRQMIDEMDLDAVGVFTPHLTHFEQAVYTLESGVNLLIEKPMVCGTANALQVKRLAEANGVVAMVHYQRHFEPAYIKVRDMIQKGVIGEVRTFHVYMAQDWSGWDWRGDPELSGGGQLNDSGSHYQDILLWMTGLLPVAVEGSMDCYHQGQRKQVPINGSFNVELSNGAGGRIIIVGDTIGGFRDDVRIAGDKGDLFFHEGVLYHRPHRQAIREVSCRLPRGYPRSPVDNFVRLVRGRSRKNRVPLVFGAAVATLTDAMLRAGETGERIGCEDLLRAADGSFDDIRFA